MTIKLGILGSGSTIYEIDKTLCNIVIAVFAVLILVIIALVIAIKKRADTQHKANLTEEKLKESYAKLENAYKEASITQKELSTKYEELKRSEENNRKIAYTDYLTEIPNRTAFTEHLDHVMNTLRKEEVVAAMYIDLDNFKNINDILGHSYGDELLIDVTHRLKQAIDENDYLARFGGDEFVVLSQNIEDIGLYEEKIHKIQKVFSYPFVLSLKEFFVTISIGVAFAPKDAKTTQSLIKNVDLAMYSAKENGKNTYCFYNESINERLMNKIEIQSELRQAIDFNEFEVFYQAQIDLESNKIAGFEALVRWNHPVKGIIAPGEFIPIAEQTGLIVPIGKWVMQEACKQLKRWEEKGFSDVTMAVNLSGRQFFDTDLVAMVKEILDLTGINPANLELEITETVVLDNIEYSVDVVEQIKAFGVRFSLDDFGTGYSAMNYLRMLPVNNIKIDKCFLDRLIENQSDQKIVSSIINLAKNLEMDVIAEGVEYEEQAEFLRSVDCRLAQGFLYSKPLPKAGANELLGRYNKKA
ncbi:putative bifunctional diguanylate cyclase/phosphodiesterase [Anaerosporobacter sp.]|uniref:putative bifunctional diguanylate cyclase/phosphodiesterase n=1 Tax=Anaerosporobacter sp. TaxID=1872529 RepID=UPI00286FA1BA|nr:EAL domain-containing protein [Anaerosporobacter sp.]